MSTALSIIVAALAILLSVVAHEYGHYKTAKIFGMKVTQFFVGFGQTIWSTRRGETEYGIKAIPAGGFVRIVGQTMLEDVDPADEPRAMYRQPLRRRLVVMSAGSAMHFVIGIVLFFIAFCGFGVYKTSTTVDSVAPCLTSVDCSEVTDPSPAVLAGLKAGDKIVAVNGVPTPRWDDLSRAIHAVPVGGVIELRVERDGQQQTLTTRTVSSSTTPATSIIGFSPGTYSSRLNPISGAWNSVDAFWQSTTGTLHAIVTLPGRIPQMFHKQDTDDSGRLISVVGATRISGNTLKDGDFTSFVGIIASLNVSIGVFNLLPLLPLDGGHIAIMLYERARSAWARRRRRPDPGRVDMIKALRPQLAFIAFFAVLSVVMIYNDIVSPVHGS